MTTIALHAHDESVETAAANPRSAPVASVLVFAEVYREWFGFVWRSARGLGVGPAAVDDVVQETFVVVHRRLPELAEGSSVRAWISAIVLNVVRRHYRKVKRKSPHELSGGQPTDPDVLQASQRDPYEVAAHDEATRLVHSILEGIDDDKREVFVLAELEGLTMPEIASALGIKLNTAYSRLRLAREEFERAVLRHQAREQRGAR